MGLFDEFTEEDILGDFEPSVQLSTRTPEVGFEQPSAIEFDQPPIIDPTGLFSDFSEEDILGDFAPFEPTGPETVTTTTLPETTTTIELPERQRPDIDEASFLKDVVVKTGADFAKAVVPYLKFVDPSERERFLKLDKQLQVRELLLQNLEAVTEIGFGIAGKTIGEPLKLFLKAKFPKMFKNLTEQLGRNKIPDRPAAIAEPTDVIPDRPVKTALAERAEKLTERFLPGGKPGRKQIGAEVIPDRPRAVKPGVVPEKPTTLDVDVQNQINQRTVEILADEPGGTLTLGRDPEKIRLARKQAESEIIPSRPEIEKPTVIPEKTDVALKGVTVEPPKVEIGDIAKPLDPIAVADDKVVTDLPKFAGSVNLRRQQVSDEAKRLELEIFERSGQKITESHDVLVGKAEKVLQSFEKNPLKLEKSIEAIKKGRTPLREEELAHRIINVSRFDNFVDASKKLESGEITLETFERMQDTITDYSLNVVNPLASDAGKRLSSYNIEVGKNRALKAISDLKKSLNERQRKELGDIIWEDPNSVNRFVDNLPDPTLKDLFYEYWYNSILSGIPTQLVNIASNTLWGSFQVPHRAFAAAADVGVSMLTGRARTRFFGEIIPLVSGFKKGFIRGAGKAREVITTGKIQEFETKWDKEIGSFLGAFDRHPNKTVRAVGKFITPPTKALRAMDTWANTAALDAQINALATRGALQKGLKGVKKQEFIKSFLENPPDKAIKEAGEFARYATFMDDPGFIGKAILSTREKIPAGLGRLAVPFVRTIGNLLKRGVEMTPGVGLALAKGQVPAEVIAKQIEGAILSYVILSKVEKGDIELVGALPESKSKRDAFFRQKKKPWSIGFGPEGQRTYVQYRRIEPFNTVIAAVAIAHDKIKNAKDDETAFEAFLDVTNSMKNNFIDSSYFQSVQSLLNRHESGKKFVPRMAVSLIPYSGLLRSSKRAIDVATEGETKLTDTSTFGGALSQVIPFMEELGQFIPQLPKVPPHRLNVWGEEIVLPGGVFRQWLPYKFSKETDDATEKFLQELDRTPGLPDQIVTIDKKKVKLDDLIYRNFVMDSGRAAKAALDKRVILPAWKARLKTERGRKLLETDIDRIIRDFRRRSRARAIREQRNRLRARPNL